MAGAEDGWLLFDDDVPAASLGTVGGVDGVGVVGGMAAVDHPYFRSNKDGEDGSDEALLAAAEEFVPTACEMLAGAGADGRSLGKSLRAAVGKFLSGDLAPSCEEALNTCAAEAWRQLRNGKRHETLLHAHAFAHALAAAVCLRRVESTEDAPAEKRPRRSGRLAEAMRHADLALLLCPDLPIPALHQLALRCDAKCAQHIASLPIDPHVNSKSWVVPSQLPTSPKVPSLICPLVRVPCARVPVAQFRSEFLQPARPAIIEGHLSAAGWSALARWPDLRFWESRHGHRFVPVELGFREDDVASGALADSVEAEGSVLLEEFVRDFLLPSNEAWSTTSPAGEACDEWSVTRVAYLAQHLMFKQMPSLQSDISVPHYCSLGALRTVNVWVGTAGTVTALHYDEDDNFLAQVAGYKYVRLYAEGEASRLYATVAPRGGGMAASFSPVRVELPDLSEYPEFANAPYEEALLGPGDMMFIPKRCWHYVRSLTTSISVNFWF